MVSAQVADSLIEKAPGVPRYLETEMDYNTLDIVSKIKKADKQPWVIDDTAKLAPTLKGQSEAETARNIYNFIFYNIRYKLDKKGEQLVKTPARLWADKEGDCKSFSLFAASLLKNLGLPYSYRFASYTALPEWTHVYVVAHTSEGDILIDPVYKKFNKEKKYKFKIDYKMPGLSIVAGIGAPGIGRRRGGFLKKVASGVKKAAQGVKKGVSKATKAVAKTTVKAAKGVAKGVSTAVKATAKVAKKSFQLVKKGALAPARNAYLLLIKLNVHGFATKVKNGDRNKISSTWEKLGGNASALWNAVEAGAKKKKILGIGGELSGEEVVGSVVFKSKHRQAALAKFRMQNPGMQETELSQKFAQAWRHKKRAKLKKNFPGVQKWKKVRAIGDTSGDETYIGYVGALPAAAAAALASAAPIIAAIKQFLGRGPADEEGEIVTEEGLTDSIPAEESAFQEESAGDQFTDLESLTSSVSPKASRAVRKTVIKARQVATKVQPVVKSASRAARATTIKKKQKESGEDITQAMEEPQGVPFYQNPMVITAGVGVLGLLGFTMFRATRGRK